MAQLPEWWPQRASLCLLPGKSVNDLIREDCAASRSDSEGTLTTMGRPRLKPKQCTVEGCANNQKCRGLCSKHYHRLLRHGDPVAGRVPNGQPLDWLRSQVQHVGEDCLTWPFGNRQGRATVTFDGRDVMVSRVMCILANGSPPDPSYHAAHSCGKGHLGCVNPRHLRWATAAENQADRVLHGTSNRGERQGISRLKAAQVREIKLALAEGVLQRVLAEKYAVTAATITSINTGARWGWLTI